MPTDLPPTGLGTYSDTDREQWREHVRVALDAGYRHVDSAQSYDNETYVGQGIADADVPRADVVLATKVDTSNLAYDDVVASTEASLDRLGVDRVDLLYVHWPVDAYDPAETLAAFDALVDRGLVGGVGLSNFTPAMLDVARDHLDAPVAAHQVECHPLCPQETLRADAADHGYRLVAYSPLAKGEVFDVPAVRAVAERRDATPAQVSLAWLDAKGVAAVPKASTPAHIRDNLAAADLALTDDDVATIDAIDREYRVIDPEWAPWNQ